MLQRGIEAKELRLDSRELSCRLMSDGQFDVYSHPGYERLISVATPMYIAYRAPIKRADGGIYIGEIFTDSRAFLKVAEDAEECFLLVCTLGLGVDHLISRESHISVSQAFITDAVADAMVEALCDAAENEICQGLTTCPRFSPGYSDLPLSIGKEIVKLVGADKRLGIRFTESEMMIPRKSVSAITCIKH